MIQDPALLAGVLPHSDGGRSCALSRVPAAVQGHPCEPEEAALSRSKQFSNFQAQRRHGRGSGTWRWPAGPAARSAARPSSGAGLKLPTSEFIVLMLVASLLLGIAGFVAQGLLVALLLAAMGPVGALAAYQDQDRPPARRI